MKYLNNLLNNLFLKEPDLLAFHLAGRWKARLTAEASDLSLMTCFSSSISWGALLHAFYFNFPTIR